MKPRLCCVATSMPSSYEHGAGQQAAYQVVIRHDKGSTLLLSKENIINRILGPVDGSGYSDRALEFAVDLTKKFCSKICIVHVISLGGFSRDRQPAPYSVDPCSLIEESEDFGQRLLTSALTIAEKAGVKTPQLK